MADQISVEIEVDDIDCAECGVPVKTLWLKNRGLLPGDYVLIADWIFHPGCWDKLADAIEGGGAHSVQAKNRNRKVDHGPLFGGDAA